MRKGKTPPPGAEFASKHCGQTVFLGGKAGAIRIAVIRHEGTRCISLERAKPIRSLRIQTEVFDSALSLHPAYTQCRQRASATLRGCSDEHVRLTPGPLASADWTEGDARGKDTLNGGKSFATRLARKLGINILPRRLTGERSAHTHPTDVSWSPNGKRNCFVGLGVLGGAVRDIVEVLFTFRYPLADMETPS